jgi:sigma-B regulation protein RsbU (phosphoserine phosphatase)
MAWQIWKVLSRDVKTATISAAQAAANQLDQTFLESQRGTKQLAQTLETLPLDEQAMGKLLKKAITSMNRDMPAVYGGSIAFKPYGFKKQNRYFMLYAGWDDGKIKLKRVGSKNYEYFCHKWFTLPKYLKQPIWSEPYYDEGCGNALMTTYSVPFYHMINGKREFMGVVTVDLSLSWLRKLVSSIRLFDSGYAFIISKFGRMISHPDPAMVMNETIFSIAAERKDSQLREIGRKMIAGKSGFVPYEHSTIYNQSCWLCYTPLSSNNWSLAVVFPHQKLFATLQAIELKTAGIGLIGIVLILIVVIAISKKVTIPLRRLTKATAEIGSGNFHTELPATSTNDEIGSLTKAFSTMQQELTRYIEELKETTAAKEKIESELNIARQIQLGILPQLRPPFPASDEFALYADLNSARAVGGDLYDFFFLDEEHLCFVIGDVSGKGVPASLFMAVTQTLNRAVSSIKFTTGEIVTRLSQSLEKNNETLMFVTFFMGILNIKSGEIQFTNAGHNPPFIIREDDKIEKIETLHGPPIAISEVEYKYDTIKLNPGDSIFLYTDGVTEAFNAKDELFGEARVLKQLNRPEAIKTPKSITESIFKAVSEFSTGTEQSDDITVLALRYLGK